MYIFLYHFSTKTVKGKGIDFNISQKGAATLDLLFLNFHTLGFKRNLDVLSDQADLKDDRKALHTAGRLSPGLTVSVASTEFYHQEEWWGGKGLLGSHLHSTARH